MVKYNVIVATNSKNVIGINNKLPWYSKEDLKYFKNVTTNNVVIMGRKTFESIGKPLPNRINIVISNTITYDDVIMVKSFDEALELASEFNKTIFVIGGATLYEQVFGNADKLYHTLIIEKTKDDDSDGDAYLKGFNEDEWLEIKSETLEDIEVDCVFRILTKKTDLDMAKERVIDVIKSCETVEHVESAFNYVNQYLTTFEDEFGYIQFMDMLNNIKNNINS